MLTGPQKNRYWKLWSLVVLQQGWKEGDLVNGVKVSLSERRYALHKAAGCPKSMTAFSNSAFNKFSEAILPLIGKVDTRDRKRENVTHCTQRMAEAIATITGSNAYADTILCSITDTKDLDKLSMYQLENMRNTFHSRLSKLITNIKKNLNFDTPPKWFDAELSNEVMISNIISTRHERRFTPAPQQQPQHQGIECPF